MNSLTPFRSAMFMPFEEEFNRLVDRMFSHDGLQAVRSKYRSGYPKLDVIETDKEYVVEVEVPGVDPNDLRVDIVPLNEETKTAFGIDPPLRRVLRLSGKKDYEYQYPEDTTFHIKEMRRSQFSREVLLPDYIKEDPVAIYEKGILRLKFSKPEIVQGPVPKQIPIAHK